MSLLDKIIAEGNRKYLYYSGDNWIECADGYRFSAVAGFGIRSTPTMELHQYVVGPFSHLEIGFPSSTPEPWDEWSKYVEDSDHPTETVYSYVPVELVKDLVARHGGERG